MKKWFCLLLAIFLVSLNACTTMDAPSTSRFIQPNPETYVNLIPVVWEYFYHLKAAVLSGDIEAFHAQYPVLSRGEQIEQGINAEAHHVMGLQGFDLLDGNIMPEYYQPIKIKRGGDQVQILTHGMALYLYRDSDGYLNQTGGEFKTIFYLRPTDLGWELYRTDQVMLAEWQDFKD